MNIGDIVANAWDRVVWFRAYGTAPGALAWYQGHRYVLRWNFRTGRTDWHKLGATPYFPPPSLHGPFHTRALFEAMGPK